MRDEERREGEKRRKEKERDSLIFTKSTYNPCIMILGLLELYTQYVQSSSRIAKTRALTVDCRLRLTAFFSLLKVINHNVDSNRILSGVFLPAFW